MADAVVVEIAKAVAQHIADSRDDLEVADFVLQRSYAEWDLDLASTGTLTLDNADKLHVDVVSHTTEQANELSARTKLRFDVPVDIGVRKKFGAIEKEESTGRVQVEEVDRLMKLTQDLHVLFTANRAPDIACATWQGVQVVVAPIRDHLREWRQFTSIVRVTFRADLKLTHTEGAWADG